MGLNYWYYQLELSLQNADTNDHEIVNVLLDHGADPTMRKFTKHEDSHQETEFGEKVTPLHVAARYGLVNVINRLLLYPEVDPNTCDINYRTPLHVAATFNQSKAVIALIEG